jgi:hypothetical protein
MDRDLMLVIPTKGGDGGSAPACSVAAVLAALVSRHGEGVVGRAVRRGGKATSHMATGPHGTFKAGEAKGPNVQCGDVPCGPVKRARMTRGARATGELEGIAGADAFRVTNASVHLTCEAEGSVPLFATLDPFDRAHRSTTLGLRGERQLVPACVRCKGGRNGQPLEGSRPRLYPKSSMTSRGVAFDSAFDRTHEIARELAGIPGVGVATRDVWQMVKGPNGQMAKEAVTEEDNRGDSLRAREAGMRVLESSVGKRKMRDRLRG